MNNRVEPTRYRCPKCGSDELRCEVTIVATVEQDKEDGEPYPIIEDLDLGAGFDDDATMMCVGGDECEHTGQAWEFMVKA